MTRNKKIRETLPEHFADIEAAADFWDTHDLSDYWDLTEEANFTVNLQARRYLVAIAHDLAERIAEEAHKQGLSSETLVNLWLSERLHETTA